MTKITKFESEILKKVLLKNRPELKEEFKTLSEKDLIKLKCIECGEKFYLTNRIWLRKDEMSFCKFCGAEGQMRKLFKPIFNTLAGKKLT